MEKLKKTITVFTNLILIKFLSKESAKNYKIFNMQLKNKTKISINKINFLIIACLFSVAIIIIRLFTLQVLEHQYYQDVASKEQFGLVELPAQRGDIIIKDKNSSNEEYALATNITLNLLFADPAIIKDPLYMAEALAPLLFNLEEEKAKDYERISEIAKNLKPEITEEEKTKLLNPLTDDELKENFKQDLLKKLSEKQRQKILLATDLKQIALDKISALALEGFEIVDNDVYAYPPKIINRTSISEKLAPILEMPPSKLVKILEGENRYVVLKNKLNPDISDKIQKMIKDDKKKLLRGLSMHEQYFRYYPEGSLAAHIIGYVNKENTGQYGIESSFNTDLQGIAGKFQTKKDSIGRQITVGESVLKPAVDGDDIVLTIDRSIQLKAEKILKEAVEKYRSDNGQMIIMNPKTGEILAMANYPNFDPNTYGDVFKKIEISLTDDEKSKLKKTGEENVYYYYKDNNISSSRYQIFEEKDKTGNIHFYRYENFVGPEAYHNKIVSWPYEPGSIFKAITMSIGIDDKDITANTKFNDAGPIGVDFNVYTQKYDYEIKNVEGYFGLINMTTVLAQSLNTGMTFVSKKIGPALFYSYMKKYGLLDRTDIEFDSEATGKIAHFENWTESELATHAFGQGITMTMLQIANAYSVIANGGILMQPYIVQEVRHDNGTTSKTEPHEIRRVISEETSATIKEMLKTAAEIGVAQKTQVPNHFVAAKTGTAQTYKNGRALFGVGTTVVSSAGFAPVDDPKFVIIVKMDYPRSSEWCAETAAPTFSKMAEFLLNYYNVPPDK
ncbi:MAG: penicillin-binding protein 2 [Candidatus Gracilibacteria bacterium]|jgi:stage V sporulation protein D (sporulation-specific penicillin-binding protein)